MSRPSGTFTDTSIENDPEDENVIKILLATDTHLGYKESDIERCKKQKLFI